MFKRPPRSPTSPTSGAWEAAGSEKPFSASCWTEMSSFAKASQDTTQGAKPGCNIRCVRVFMEECYAVLKPRLLLDGVSLSSLWLEEVVVEEEKAAVPLVAAAASAAEESHAGSNDGRTAPAAAAAAAEGEGEEGEGECGGENGAEDGSKDRRTLTAGAGTEEHRGGETKGGEPAAQREGRSTDGKEGNTRGTEGKQAGTAKDTEGKEGKDGDTDGKESNGMDDEGEANQEEGQADHREENTNHEELRHVLHADAEHAPPRAATPELPPAPRYTAPKQVVDEDHELPDRVYDWILETELSARKAMTCKKMERAFDIIDEDKSGDIDLDELRVAFDMTKGKAGSAIQLQQIFHSDDVLRTLATYER